MEIDTKPAQDEPNVGQVRQAAKGDVPGHRQVSLARRPVLDPARELHRVAETEALLRAAMSESGHLDGQAKARLAALLRQKDEILALASHDMRTPLACLHGALDLLQPTLNGMNEDQRHLMGMVRRAADALALLVGNLAAVGGAAMAEEDGELGGTDMTRLCRELADLTDVPARRRKVSLSIDAGQSVLCPGDPLLLRQVVANLLSSAVRTVAPGTCVRVCVEQPDPHEARITVENGADAKPTDVEALARQFEDGDPFQGQDDRGERVTLYVVGQLVHRLDGSIEVWTNASGGRAIGVTLPAIASQ